MRAASCASREPVLHRVVGGGDTVRAPIDGRSDERAGSVPRDSLHWNGPKGTTRRHRLPTPVTTIRGQSPAWPGGWKARVFLPLVWLACLLVFAWGRAAVAHVGLPGGTHPFVVDGVLKGGGTSWGIVMLERGVPVRVCEEATGMVVFFYARGVGDRVLVGGTGGLVVTDDDGCTYAQVPGFAGLFVSTIGVARDAPDTVFVGANALAEARLMRSVDGGDTFAPTSLVVPELGLSSIVVSDDAARVVVSGVALSGHPRTFVSDDGGETFDERSIWPDEARSAAVLGFDVDGDHVLALILDDTTLSTLVRVDPGFTSFVVVEQFESIVTDYAAYQGARLIVLADRDLRRQVPGVDPTFVPVDDAPMGCLVRPPGEDTLWMCGQPDEGFHFFSSSDGFDFAPFMAFDDVVERACPAGTPGDVRCDFSIPDAGGVQEPDAGGPDAGQVDAGSAPPPPAEGCSCGGGGMAALLGLGLRRRRALKAR